MFERIQVKKSLKKSHGKKKKKKEKKGILKQKCLFNKPFPLN